MSAVETHICALCGAAIPRGAPMGQCPRCLLKLIREGDDEATPDDELLDAGQVRRVGDYELIEEIARGGMGVVYRARQISLGREVAVKMILAGELATPESVQRFRNEASAAARLEHPHIVSVYEIGEHEAQHFFSMRLVPGRRNIAQWAKALAVPNSERWPLIARMMAKVARAVSFAHERGVLHRDLKPSNILVDDRDEPQVTDFGLAKLLHGEDSALTVSVLMMGSPSYMAPEQADGRHGDVTTLTDVHGLGAVLYEMLAGRPPFLGATPLATAKQVVEQEAARLPGVPRDLETLCLKCLTKEPALRYASAHELANELERFARGEPIHARPLDAYALLWRWAHRNPRIATLLAALVLVFVLGFAGVTWQWRRAERAQREQALAVQRLQWEEIVRQAGSDEASTALTRLATLLRKDPRHWQAAMLAMSVIDQNAFPMLAGPSVLPEVKLTTPVRLSPDGAWFAAAGEDQTVRVWSAASGRETKRIALPSLATALAPGATSLAIAMKNGQVQWRDVAGEKAVTMTRTGTESVEDLRLSQDGSLVIARSKDRIEVWSSGALEPAHSWQLEGGVTGAVLSPDGARVLGWNAKHASVWQTSDGVSVWQAAATERFRAGVISADGRRVALADPEFAARVWDVETGGLAGRIESPLSNVEFVALNHDGSRLTVAGSASDIHVYDVASGLVVSLRMQHLYSPLGLRASMDGKRTLSWARDGRACLWDADTGRSVLSAIWIDTDMPRTAELSADGGTVLLHPATSLSGEPRISVWRLTKTMPVKRMIVEGQRDFFSGRLSPDGKLGALGLFPRRAVLVYELETDRVLLDAAVKGDPYVNLFSPDMRCFYALTANGWLYGWSLADGRELWPPQRQPGLIRPAEISDDGQRILVGYTDGHIRVHDTATGEVLRVLEEPGTTKTLRYAPDGSERFVSGSSLGMARVWDARTGAMLHELKGHRSDIIASAWSPDARYIATASYDRDVRVWDAQTGRMVGQPMPHLASLSHLEFSPDGRLLATACRDGTARLWHPLTGEPASKPLPQSATVVTVRFTRDGQCFLVRDHAGFRFWDTANAEPVTVHFHEPLTAGKGMDSEAYHAFMTPDGTRVHLGDSINYGALYTIAQPRGAVPDWFPDLLETLALLRSDDTGTSRVHNGEDMAILRERIARDGDSEYAAWARRLMEH